MREVTTTVRSYAEWKAYDEENGTSVAETILEKHRDWNTDHEWWDCLIHDCKEFLKAVGFSDPDVRFSGFWSQGDGASWTGGWINMQDLVSAHRLLDKLTREGWVPRKQCPECGYIGKPKADCPDCEGTGRVPVPLPALPKHAELIATSWDDIWYGRVTRGTSNYAHENTCTWEGQNELPSSPTGEKDKGGWNIYKPDHPRLAAELAALDERMEDWRVEVCSAIYHDLEAEHEYLCSEEQLAEGFEANELEFYEDGRIA